MALRVAAMRAPALARAALQCAPASRAIRMRMVAHRRFAQAAAAPAAATGAAAPPRVDMPPADGVEKAPPHVLKIAEDVLGLSVLDSLKLVEVLKLRLGIPADQLMMFGAPMAAPAGAPGAGAAAAASGAAPAAAPAEEKKEKFEFDVKLVSFDAKDKIKIIKEVRTVTGLGLKQAKDLVEAVPCVIKKNMVKEDAEKVFKLLTESGAQVVME